MEPSPLSSAHTDIPSITIYVTLETDMAFIEAVREAVYELRNKFGIYIDYEIIPLDHMGSHGAFIRDEVRIDIFGVPLVFSDVFEDFESDTVNTVKSEIVEEVLRNIGATRKKETALFCPWSMSEKPRYADAVLAAR